MSRYDQQAADFLKKHNLSISLNMHILQKVPLWAALAYGDSYAVTITRQTPEAIQEMTFDFWGSLVDREEGKAPSDYDILACLASDINAPTDPDEVYQEFGGMLPSQARAVADFAKRLQEFFTEDERAGLSEIQ